MGLLDSILGNLTGAAAGNAARGGSVSPLTKALMMLLAAKAYQHYTSRPQGGTTTAGGAIAGGPSPQMGGGMGPALIDNYWTYGGSIQQIYSSIRDGRKNGMPAWKYMLSTQQIWQLTAYVRSLSGLNPKGARSGRDDHMMGKPAENQTPNAKPKNTNIPAPSIAP